jgi:hypothetical protein
LTPVEKDVTHLVSKSLGFSGGWPKIYFCRCFGR